MRISDWSSDVCSSDLHAVIGVARHACIRGLPVEESEELLNTPWAHTAQERFSWHHKWRAGDLVIWDNRCAMHRRDDFDPNTPRSEEHTSELPSLMRLSYAVFCMTKKRYREHLTTTNIVKPQRK